MNAVHKISNSLSDILFNEEGMAEVNVAGKKICIARYGDSVYAFAAACPHAGAPLVEGYTDSSGNIVCAKHCYKFSLANGKNTSGEGYRLTCYPATVSAEGVFLTL